MENSISPPWKSLTYNITPDGVPEVLVNGKPIPIADNESAELEDYGWSKRTADIAKDVREFAGRNECDDEFFAAMAMPEGENGDE